MYNYFISQTIRKKIGFARLFWLCYFLTVLSLGLHLNYTISFATEKHDLQTKLWLGTGTASITPSEPVALDGQMYLRVAKEVESPVTANVVVMESREGDRSLDVAVSVSCDLVSIPSTVIDKIRRQLHKRLPDLDVGKIFLNATHTHTAPCARQGYYDIPNGVMQAETYHNYLAERVTEAIEKAWESRRPGGVSWGLGHAVVAYNRRIVYADGSAKMCGQTTVDDFRRIEGREDQGVEVLFFWDDNKNLIATAINVACPSQVIGDRSVVSADFWHVVRKELREQHGKDLCVLAWCGAAGDQCPFPEWRKQAEERMNKLRGLTQLEEISRRIVRAVDDAYEIAKSDVHYDVQLVHVVKDIELPVRMVTDAEYVAAKAKADEIKNNIELSRKYRWYKDVLDRYETQKTNRFYGMRLHVIRLGDVAIATNPFELFTDYGIQMKARSKALQTFIIQLAGPGTYLPTAEAVKGGGYSATVENNLVGPESGQVLVDHTVAEINKLWDSEENKD